MKRGQSLCDSVGHIITTSLLEFGGRRILRRMRLFTLLLLLTTPTFAQTSPEAAECWSFGYHGRPECEVSAPLQVARRIPTTAAQAKRWGATARVFSIDLDSDGAADFIIESRVDEEKTKTCFVASTGVVHHCAMGLASFDGFVLRWFAQLDDTPLLELFEMEGDPRATFWGYPWDIRSIPIDVTKGPRLSSAEPSCIDQALAGMKGVAVPIFFSGTPTQGAPSDEWVALATAAKPRTLSELVALTSSKQKCGAAPAKK